MTETTVEILDGLTWPLVYSKPCSAMQDMDDGEVERLEQLAAEFLYRWTAQQFGTRTISGILDPYSMRWNLRPSTFEGRGPRSNLIAPPAVYRNANPKRRNGIRVRSLVDVISIRIAGETFDGYEVVGNVIYRTDGQTWFNLHDLEVELTVGAEVPISGRVASGLLACEFAKAAIGDEDCQLPARVQSVTREGVTIAVMDQFEDLHKGHTGVWMVDQWVASIIHAPRPSGVMSPDYKQSTTRTGRTW